MRPIARLLLAVLTAALLTSLARAQDAETWAKPGTTQAGVAPTCDEGTWSVQALSGYEAKTSLGPGRKLVVTGSGAIKNTLEYVPLELRLGYEFPRLLLPDTPMQGTFQALFEYDYFAVTRTFGSYFTGPCALFRYNFLQPETRLTPYLQGGAGLLFNDAYRDPSQRLIGRWQEFLLQAGLGVRFALTDRLSLDVEGDFQHISNARLAHRNAGVNNAGVLVGFTYTFGGW
jgi:opacity protein-like surface antigen